MEEPTIRPIRPQDNAPMAALIRSILEEMNVPRTGTAFTDANLDRLSDYYREDRRAYYVVTLQDRVLGGGGIAPLEGGGELVCELQKMYLHTSLRGKGLGKQLLHKCLDTARALGFHRCYLETMPYMKAAQALYREVGFESLGSPMGNTGHHACQVWMCLDLRKSGGLP